MRNYWGWQTCRAVDLLLFVLALALALSLVEGDVDELTGGAGGEFEAAEVEACVEELGGGVRVSVCGGTYGGYFWDGGGW